MKSFYDIKNKIDTLNNQGDRQTIDGIEHRNKTVEKEIQRLIPKLNKLQDHLNKIQSNRVSLTEQSQDMNMIQPVGAQMAATCNDMTCAMPMDTTTDTMNDQMSGDTEYNMTSPIESDMQNTPMAENIMISADTQTMMPSDTVVSPVEEPMPMMDASIQPIVSSQTMPMDNNNSSEVIITNPDAPINTPIPSDQMM